MDSSVVLLGESIDFYCNLEAENYKFLVVGVRKDIVLRPTNSWIVDIRKGLVLGPTESWGVGLRKDLVLGPTEASAVKTLVLGQ